MGYPTERTIIVNGARAFGGTVAAPIWASYMRKALKGEPKLQFPTAKSPRYTPSKFSIPVSKPPKLVGLKLAKAIGKLDGYTYKVAYAYSKRPKGTVIAQKVSGTKLTLVVSKGPAPVKAKPKPKPPSGNTSGTPDATKTP